MSGERAAVPAAAPESGVERLVDHLFRHQAGRVVSALTRLFGSENLDLAEDVVQEALVAALRQWPFRGVPDNPRAWLTEVAKNRALDRLRRDRRLREKGPEIRRWLERGSGRGGEPEAAFGGEATDDNLAMIFLCCHPAVPRGARVALTLKTVGGFGVGEIAAAFLLPEATVAQRLVRAKRRLRRERPAFAPAGAKGSRTEWVERLDSVLDVLYLLFNEGYSAHQGEALVRRDLCAEAVRLVSLLAVDPVLARPEVHAMAALFLLQGARLPARADAQGDLLLLAEQDRALWDREWIARGFRHLERAATGEELTAVHLEAGIAACHAAAPSWEATDWHEILRLYDLLLARRGSPIVALNRAVALAMVEDPAAALAALDRLARHPALARYYLLPATRGDLYARLGDLDAAAADFRRALALTSLEPARRFLDRRLAACERGGERAPRHG